jgi:histidine ammonia-lyase
MTVRAIAGNPRHFDRAIFELKPHPGTRRAAEWIGEDLEPSADCAPRGSRTSTRCAARRT